MKTTTWNATQCRAGYAMMGAIAAGFVWAASPDLQAWRGILSMDRSSARPIPALEFGESPFGGVVVPPPGLRSCGDCHALGGGATDQPVPAFELFPPQGRQELRVALVEVVRPASAVTAAMETSPSRPAGGVCPANGLADRRAPVGPGDTPPLFGLGLVDRIPGRAILSPAPGSGVVRAGDSEVVVPGRARILPDGRVGKFGRKARYATLTEFVAATCEDQPAAEEMTDDDSLDRRIRQADRIGELRDRLVNLPRPEAIRPDSAADADSARRGEAHFAAVGCVACHKPDLGGLRGVYGDFLLHRLDDRADAVPLAATAAVLAEEWRTPPLWGVADTAPYLHDGSASTLEAAIVRHGGDAAAVRRAYEGLDEGGRGDVVAFLRTLKAPATAAAERLEPRRPIGSTTYRAAGPMDIRVVD